MSCCGWCPFSCHSQSSSCLAALPKKSQKTRKPKTKEMSVRPFSDQASQYSNESWHFASHERDQGPETHDDMVAVSIASVHLFPSAPGSEVSRSGSVPPPPNLAGNVSNQEDSPSSSKVVSGVSLSDILNAVNQMDQKMDRRLTSLEEGQERLEQRMTRMEQCITSLEEGQQRLESDLRREIQSVACRCSRSSQQSEHHSSSSR